METAPAPFSQATSDGPPGGSAHWITAADGVRLRIAHWPSEARRGTVALFPGRTEYVEKYGRTARDFVARGYDVVSIDWRGQGLADRLTRDRQTGHVGAFIDYQQDVTALWAAMNTLDLPGPRFLIAHSMGGCIGLRAVMEGLEVNAVVFSAPMWGILIAPALRPVAWTLGWGSERIGLGHLYAPGTGPKNYVEVQPFDGNTLTRDPEMYGYMQAQLADRPELGIGGPSFHWVHEALAECRTLARRPAPKLPCLTFLGTEEKIVDPSRIRDRMAHWIGGALRMVDGAEHEVLMERPGIRHAITAEVADFFDANLTRRDDDGARCA